MKKKARIKPRRRWVINPVTRVKKSDKAYSRQKARENLKNILGEGKNET